MGRVRKRFAGFAMYAECATQKYAQQIDGVRRTLAGCASNSTTLAEYAICTECATNAECGMDK